MQLTKDEIDALLPEPAATNQPCIHTTTDRWAMQLVAHANWPVGTTFFTRDQLTAFAAAVIAAHTAKVLGDVEPVAEFGGRRQTPEGTTEFWGVLLEPWDAPPKGSQLYSASTVAALKAERDAALARVAELEKDAARYQKLLDLWNGRDMRELFGIEDFAALDAAPQPQQEQP